MARKRKTIVGIKGNDAAARAIARMKKLPYATVAISTYRAGERVARVLKRIQDSCVLVRDIEANPETVWDVLLAADALKRAGAKRLTLLAPWVAYGRQDRPAHRHESVGGIVLADALRPFKRILTVDAHSPAFTAHFHGRMRSVPPVPLIVPCVLTGSATRIAAPDEGGFVRADAVARHTGIPLIRCNKKRIKPGIRGVRTVCDPEGVKGARVVIIDDMVDSGGTLREAARNLKRFGATSVSAIVTHAADPDNKPSARELELSSLLILYPRKGKISNEFVKLLSGAIR